MGCTTFNLLIGPSNSQCGHTCQILLWTCSTIVTLLTRIAFLLLCIYHSNCILVTLNPPSTIAENHTCSNITIVTNPQGYQLYKPSQKKQNFYYLAQDSGRIDGELQESTQYLSGHGTQWTIHSTDAEQRAYSYDDDGYQKVYYYCGDITNLLNTIWLPFITWIMVIIFPQLLLSSIVFLMKLKRKSFKILFVYPGFTLSSIISHHNIGPVSWSKNTHGLIHSKLLSYINILLTFLGMCLLIHFSTITFGGDSRDIRVIMVIVIFVPMFIISAIFTVAFLHNCCSVQKKVFNPENPNKYYILSGVGSVIPKPEEYTLAMGK